MSGKTLLVVILVPLALAVPIVLVKLVVRDKDQTVPVEMLRSFEVATVEYYGVRLDEKATPRDVVRVLLAGVKDIYKAADAPTRQEQSEGVRRGQEIMIALAAPQAVADNYIKSGIPIKTEQAKQKLVLRTILSWPRALGYYIDGDRWNQPDTWQETIRKAEPDQPAQAVVHFETQQKASRAQVVVNLTRESDHWRINRVTLAPPSKAKKTIVTTGPATTKPASAPTAPPKASQPPTQPVAKPKAQAPPPPVVKKTVPATKPQPKVTPKPEAASKPAPKPKTAPKPAPPKPKAAPASRPVSKPATTTQTAK